MGFGGNGLGGMAANGNTGFAGGPQPGQGSSNPLTDRPAQPQQAQQQQAMQQAQQGMSVQQLNNTLYGGAPNGNTGFAGGMQAMGAMLPGMGANQSGSSMQPQPPAGYVKGPSPFEGDMGGGPFGAGMVQPQYGMPAPNGNMGITGIGMAPQGGGMMADQITPYPPQGAPRPAIAPRQFTENAKFTPTLHGVPMQAPMQANPAPRPMMAPQQGMAQPGPQVGWGRAPMAPQPQVAPQVAPQQMQQMQQWRQRLGAALGGLLPHNAVGE